MTTTTGTERPSGSRDASFDALISSERAESATPDRRHERMSEIEHLVLEKPSAPKASRKTASMVWPGVAAILLAAALIIFAVTALVTSPQQAARAASVDEAGAVTAASVAAQVEQGWTDAGGSGSVTCPEPAAQAPGTSIDCTGVYDSAPLVFTAVIGDTAAGEPRIVISSWSEVASG